MDFPGARMDAGRVLLGSATTLALSSAGSAHPVLVVIGPSGSGKSSLVQALAKTGEIAVHPTWTTRPPRADECEGCVEHRFFSEQAFAELRAALLLLGDGDRVRAPLPLRPAADGALDRRAAGCRHAAITVRTLLQSQGARSLGVPGRIRTGRRWAPTR